MKKRILIVDDDPAMALMAKANLDRVGHYDIRTENLAQRALETTREFRPDLILLDVLMPGMLGSEVAAQLDADPNLSKIKYVFLTCMLTTEEALKSSGEIGGHIFLAKPILAVELCRVVKEQLQ